MSILRPFRAVRPAEGRASSIAALPYDVYTAEEARRAVEAGWTLQRFTYDLHHHEELNKDNVMTEYEEKFSQKGNPINMLIAVRK